MLIDTEHVLQLDYFVLAGQHSGESKIAFLTEDVNDLWLLVQINANHKDLSYR